MFGCPNRWFERAIPGGVMLAIRLPPGAIGRAATAKDAR
jgi:hypothetical protein